MLASILAMFACSRIAVAQVSFVGSVSTDQNSASSTITSPAFSSTAPNELLLAFIATDSTGSTNTTVKSVTGAGLTWNLVKRTNTEAGTAEIWRALAPSAQSNIRISATLSQSVVSSMTVSGFTGVSTAGTYGSGAIGAVASGYSGGGAPAATLVTTQAGSLVVGVGNDYDNAIVRSPNSGQTLMHQDLSSTGDTYWVQRLNATVAAQGTAITLGDSAPTTDRYNLSICEIVPRAVSSGNSSPQLSLSTNTLAFGNDNLNTVSTKSLTLSSTGTAAVQLNSATLSGSGFSMTGITFPLTLNPGQTATLQVSFDPTVAGAASGTIAISSNSSSGNSSTVTLSGSGTTPQLAVSASSLAFGNVGVNTTSTKTLTLTSSGTGALTVKSDTISGTGFIVSGGTFPTTLNPGQTMSLQVSFDPPAAASDSGSIVISSNSSTGGTTTVTLSGTGTTNPVLSLSSTSLNFGSDPVGTPLTQTLTLTSTGASAVTVSAANLTGAAFSLSGATFPVTLNPNIAIKVQVQFDPTAVGTASGTLTFSSNSSTGSTSIVNLTGNGTAIQHQVSLSWAAPASGSDAVTGYRVYRATGTSTSYQQLASSSNTAYVDTSVQASTAYSYYVTSVDSSGNESTASNYVTATVP